MSSKKRKLPVDAKAKESKRKAEKNDKESDPENANLSDCGSQHSTNSDGQQKCNNGGASVEPGSSKNVDEVTENEELSPKHDEVSEKNESPEPFKNMELSKNAGTLLFSGGTNWDLVGRKELPKAAKTATGENLWGPHRLSALSGIRVSVIISSSTSCHSVIITEDGDVMTWGRNDKGQLGLGDILRKDSPTLVPSFSKHGIVSAACGRNHTLFLTADGDVYACGDNKLGQCGVGSQNNNWMVPKKISYNGRKVSQVACGGEFSVLLDNKGGVYTFGCPEYGQLGHNTDGRYFITNNKLAFKCELSPRRVISFIEKTREGHVTIIDSVRITEVACGINHTVAVDDKGRCFSWGFGGYGRLGHAEQKDEMVPRLLKFFDGPNRGVKRVYAGGSYCLAVNEYDLLFFWGQNKRSGEATMYPKPVQDLTGWKVHQVACCNTSIVVLADESVISWGPSPTWGELCYGPTTNKSSTAAQEAKPLEGIHITRVSCGYAHTLLIAQDTTEEDRAKINLLPEFTPE